MRKCFALVWLFTFDVGSADFENIKKMLRHKLVHSGFDFSNLDTNVNGSDTTNGNDNTDGRDEEEDGVVYNDMYYDEYYDSLNKITEEENNTQNDANINIPQTADGLGDE